MDKCEVCDGKGFRYLGQNERGNFIKEDCDFCDGTREKRNYYQEALLILDKKYPELELETFRYIKQSLNMLPEVAHLKALWDKIEEIVDREEKDTEILKNNIRVITLDDVPHKYQKRLLELCKD